MLDYNYMTEESDHSDCVVQHSLIWRSEGIPYRVLYMIVGWGGKTRVWVDHTHFSLATPIVHTCESKLKAPNSCIVA